MVSPMGWLLRLLLLFSLAAAIQAVFHPADKSTDNVKRKICIGTNGRMSVPSNREHHYRNLRERYINCSYVDGNLELTWIQDENLDLSFLQHIREVTGYVLISHVHVRRVVLPRLQIIRGRSLFRLSIHQQEFALLISLCKMHTIEMPALRDILSGGVGLFNNYNLCHIRSINWKEIITGPSFYDVYVYNFTSPERDCPSCDPECSGGCWGEGKDNCQQFSKINCSPQCSKGRCFGPNPRECCHLFCAGGCTGPKQNDCLACRNFYDDGECTQECPPMQSYNPSTYSWEVNPRGKYAYGATCVKNCPEHLLKDNGACVRSCPPGKKAVKGECVPCDGPCPKACEGVDLEGSVHSGNIKRFEGCTVIDGSITILDHSFVGFQQVYNNFSFGARHAPLHPDRLEVFNSVKEITGYINIQASHPDFKNLSYFRNLEVIGGRTLTEYFAVFIVKTSLTSLGLQSLKKISSGSIGILENKDLCYADGIKWDSIKLASGHRTLIQHNQEAELCSAEGKICDAECSTDGCWGPGPDQCLSCNNFKFGNKCLQNCSAVAGMYTAGLKKCMPCHEQCESTCYGPGPGNCTSCRHVRDGPFCSPFCPSSKFDDGGECQLCHSNCVDGCVGPENNIGPRGCKSCDKAVINGDVNVESCLHKNESCPVGYYLEYVGPQDQGPLRQLAGKAICRKCHPRCKRCTGYGFHVQVCQECANYKRGEQCEDECPQDHYADETTRACLQCHTECKGCYGPDPSHCYTCRNFKLYQDGEGPPQPGANETMFNCTEICPSEASFKIFPEDSNREPYCSSSPRSAYGPTSKLIDANSNTQYIIIGFVVLLLLVIGCPVLYCYRNERKDKAEQVKMTRVLSGIEDEPLRPSNVKPNLAKLNIIDHHDLKRGKILGMGAFGTVYQGVWTKDEKTKIPVAIKVLRHDQSTGGGGSNEFLDEARIMATVDHPNLLQLLAVSMPAEMQLVTQLMPLGCLLDFVRKHKDKLGSKSLLKWCTQIARGMEYLEERRLVHRDLAARNVLVQSQNQVKITDFGLAKLLDVDEDVYKAGGGKMPIKWLALECIQHRVFTHKSDVWAFGVTIWEVFTYGDRPYDHLSARDVPDRLERGERLPQPAICTIDVYMIMVACWLLDADSRPTFKRLAEDFGKMSQDPGRYLVVPGDKLSRVAEEPHQHTYGHGATALPEVRHIPDHRHRPRPSSSTSPSPPPPHELPGRYSVDPLHIKEAGDENIFSEPAMIGDLKLELPLDEDDYLVPSLHTGSTSPYMDIIGDNAKPTFLDAQVVQRLAAGATCVDNPEYLLNNTQGEGEIGIPIVITHHTRHKSSEDESDHEYYNDLDRQQRERQPLRRNETTV